MFSQCLEIITIGLPFCAFKIVTGSFLNQWWLIALGAIDLLINIGNLCSLLFLKRRIVDACLLSFLVRLLKKPSTERKEKWQDLGNSIDVLLSFTLVAYMIGGGYIRFVPEMPLRIWNLSVVLNVFGAGYSRLTGSIQNLKD